ncbi:menaquinone biosynthesis protein [Pseudodesulfovibrio sp. zrk46]|uniref:menaquinone biosynthetic enzyme MqnA/MqnD family protein n=1 Tax=Pseudodesulfovibrio sp. zrk46 TaxID=2725288 RepID=UPI001449934F|nr:menaquinone biosynthesis protein [Pseudodesulfovibrio sp. zrk46]QJB58148.1 menaquinone biosynthesis protein [Pseudodesulfovibrio sp. zrk46]
MTIRLGKIGYLNVLPIYHPLETGLIEGDFDIVSGPPSALNRLMDAGELDISAASSIEYARHPEKYYLLPNIAIGSRGPVQSVLLLSQYSIEELSGKTILVSSQTHTSAALLKVLLAEWKVNVKYVSGDATSELKSGKRPDAILAIGDEALNLRYHPDYPHRTDLGEAWRDLTSLPFIFGVWIVQRTSLEKNGEVIRTGCAKLLAGKNWGSENITAMCTLASEDSCLNATEMCSYFDGLVYDFGENEQKGLKLFYQHLKNNGIIDAIPELTFLPQN